MKKITYTVIAVILTFSINSCEIDNYTAPGETLMGQISDPSGKAIQFEQGKGSGKIKMEELKFENPVPLYLNVKLDGSYYNSKVFAGEYRIFPEEGPFYPLDSLQYKIVNVKGTTTANFEVVPYLNLEWVSEPSVTADKKVTASFKFTRSAAPAGLTQPGLADYQLFVSTTEYVGSNNYDNTVVGGVVTLTDAMENQELTITSSQPMKYSTTYYVRIGARVNDSFKKYNYTDIKSVVVP